MQLDCEDADVAGGHLDIVDEGASQEEDCPDVPADCAVGTRPRRRDTARLLASLSYLLYVMSLFAAAGMALATATLALWMRAFPAWLGWLSVLATIAGVLGIWGITGLVVLAWIVVLSAYMVWPRPAPAAQPPGLGPA
jgi:hypothetical protein